MENYYSLALYEKKTPIVEINGWASCLKCNQRQYSKTATARNLWLFMTIQFILINPDQQDILVLKIIY